MSEEARRNFSFTPAVNEESRKNRAITVVIRKRDDASSAARTAALTQGRTTPVAITPVAYDLARRRSEEHTSELQSLMRISYAVFCLKKKKTHRVGQATYQDRTHGTYSI